MIVLFKNSCKRAQNIFVLMTGFYLLAYLLTGINNEASTIFSSFIFYVICSVAIFVMSLNMFHYLHDKTSATHLLSLPYTKIQICLVNYLAGMMIISIPSTLYAIAMSITKSVSLTTTLVPVLLFIFIYYTLGCLIANVTGKISMHIFMYSIQCMAPVLLYTCLLTVISQYVYGMNGPDISSTIIYILLPVARLAVESLNLGYGLLYLGYGIGLFVLMLYVASKRPFEKTGAPLAFENIEFIVRFFIVLIVSWLCMTLFTTINNQNLPFTCILCAIVVTCIVELIFNKKIHVLRSMIHVVSICVITLVVFFATTNYYQYYIPNAPISAQIDFGYETLNQMELKDPQAITAIKNFHEYLMNNTSKDNTGLCNINIRYATSPSDTIHRLYSLNVDTYNRAITEFKQEEGYSHAMHAYYQKALSCIDTEINSLFIYNGEKNIEVKKEEVERFKQCVRLQIERHAKDPTLYQEIDFYVTGDDYKNNNGYIQIELKKKDMYHSFSIYKNDPIYRAYEMMKEESKAK